MMRIGRQEAKHFESRNQPEADPNTEDKIAEMPKATTGTAEVLRMPGRTTEVSKRTGGTTGLTRTTDMTPGEMTRATASTTIEESRIICRTTGEETRMTGNITEEVTRTVSSTITQATADGMNTSTGNTTSIDENNGTQAGHINNMDHTETSGPLQMKLSLQIINVCGLRRKIEIPEFKDALKSHDISLLCETKLDDADSENIQEAIKDLNLKVFFFK